MYYYLLSNSDYILFMCVCTCIYMYYNVLSNSDYILITFVLCVHVSINN